MKKKQWYKFFNGISILLLIGFVIRLGADYMMYDAQTTSFPFYAKIVERTFEFVVPSIIIFIVGKWIKNKYLV